MTYQDIIDSQNQKITKFSSAFGYLQGYIGHSYQEWSPEFRLKLREWMDTDLWKQIMDENVKELDLSNFPKP